MEAARLRAHGLASSSGRCSNAAPSPSLRRCGRFAASRCRRAAATFVTPRASAERKEYYDFKDMPPLPLGVKRIHVPSLGFTVVDKSLEERRMASLAIYYDIWGDAQYGRKLTRRSAITALCMYDRDDVSAAERSPGSYPCIDLLQRVYAEGLELDFEVEEFAPAAGGGGGGSGSGGSAL